jgi:hypothetical protein
LPNLIAAAPAATAKKPKALAAVWDAAKPSAPKALLSWRLVAASSFCSPELSPPIFT